MIEELYNNLLKIQNQYTKCPKRKYLKETNLDKLKIINGIRLEFISKYTGDNSDLKLKFDKLFENTEKLIKENICKTEVDNKTDNFKMDQLEFLRLCAQTINKNYTGDPLSLAAFINSIKLLKSVMGTHEKILIQFILTKLEIKALECCPRDPKSVEEIILSLSDNIKPDSSKVIESKMVSLKLDSHKIENYVVEIEHLADALQRSLIVEGISQIKAKSMAVEKTVEICKKSANTDLVKAVIASSTFENPKEVLAKFITETAETRDAKIFSYRKYNNNHNRNYSHRNNSKNNGYYRGNKNHRGNYQYNNQNKNYFNTKWKNSKFVRYAENISGPSGALRADIQAPDPEQQQ